MDFRWEEIGNFGSLRERDTFLAWLQIQIAKGIAEEIEGPVHGPLEAGERWFRHVPSGSLWRLIPAEDPYGPAFWAAYDEAA